MVHSKLRPQSCWSFAVTYFPAVRKSEGCSISHPGKILARDWSARIGYIVTCYIVALQTCRQTEYNTSLPLAGEVINCTY